MAPLFHRLHYQLSVSFFCRSHYNKYTVRRRPLAPSAPLVNIGRRSNIDLYGHVKFPNKWTLMSILIKALVNRALGTVSVTCALFNSLCAFCFVFGFAAEKI